jgi:hypothetical protein
MMMVSKQENSSIDYKDKLPIDGLRYMIVNAIEALTKKKMQLDRIVKVNAKTP